MKKLKILPFILCSSLLFVSCSLVSCSSSFKKDDIKKIFIKVPKYLKYDTFQKKLLDVSVLTKNNVIYHIKTNEFECSLKDGEKLLNVGTFKYTISLFGLNQDFNLIVDDIRHAEFKLRESNDYFSSTEPNYQGERIECYITEIVSSAPISCFYRMQQNSYFTIESLTHNGIEIPYTKSIIGNHTDCIRFETLSSGDIKALVVFNSGPKEFSSGCKFCNQI